MAIEVLTGNPTVLSRRQLLATMVGSLIVSQTTGCQWLLSGSTAGEVHIGAVRLGDDTQGLQGVNSSGQALWQLAVHDRCHGGCNHTGAGHAVVFERRPGWRFYVLEPGTGKLVQEVPAASGEHFYGHGVFSHDGRRLYATVNCYDTGDGLVAVYDVARSYRRVGSLPLDGIGPHELRLHPDGQTLLIALGGIRTHPDYPRLKQNLDTMAPALVLMDRHSGKITGRHKPSHHQLSCRHLDVSPDGHVWVGYQYQGPDYDSPPLIGHFDGSNFRDVSLPDRLQRRLANYTASVAVSPVTGHVAITAPRGGVAMVLNGTNGSVHEVLDIPDCAGVKALRDGSFLISSGTGRITRYRLEASEALATRHSDLQWDNHLI